MKYIKMFVVQNCKINHYLNYYYVLTTFYFVDRDNLEKLKSRLQVYKSLPPLQYTIFKHKNKNR